MRCLALLCLVAGRLGIFAHATAIRTGTLLVSHFVIDVTSIVSAEKGGRLALISVFRR